MFDQRSSHARPHTDRPIVVLGGAESHLLFLERLHKRCGDYVLLDYNPNAPGRRWASRFLDVSIHDPAECIRRIREAAIHPSAIISFATGRAGDSVLALSRHFNLPSSARSESLCRAVCDKAYLSQRLRRHAMPVPREFQVNTARPVSLEIPGNFRFPAIVKPVDGGGGIEVGAADDRDALFGLLTGHRNADGRRMLVQEKLVGTERLIYLFVKDGRPVTVAHGVNQFDPQSGWPWPVGLIFETISDVATAPAWLRRLAGQIITLFNLKNDFIAVELIDTGAARFVIDVELNAFTAFACSRIVDNGQLIELLLDIYLNQSVAPTHGKNWISGLTFLFNQDRARVVRPDGSRVDASRVWVEQATEAMRLRAFEHDVFKGGHVIVRHAASFQEAADLLLDASRTLVETVAGNRSN